MAQPKLSRYPGLEGSEIQKQKASILAGDGSLIGRPVPGAQVKILPAVRPPMPNFEKDYAGLNQGEIGEICVSGKMVTAGYDRMPGATCDARFKIGDAEFHRMGDLGYFDPSGSLRFLGRKAECVYTANGPFETERCEPLINQLDCVQKCALIGLGSVPNQEPCLVVQPNRQEMRQRGEHALREEILNICRDSFLGFDIERVFFQKKIPVDARHNAKIHRLALSRKWTSLVARKSNAWKITMKILVTGGLGFVGNAIVRSLLAEGHEVHALGRTSDPPLNKLIHGLHYHCHDLSGHILKKNWFEGTDTVFHVAAKAGVGGRYEEYKLANLIATEQLLLACSQMEVSHFIYTSTPSVSFSTRPIRGGDESLPYSKEVFSPMLPPRHWQNRPCSRHITPKG